MQPQQPYPRYANEPWSTFEDLVLDSNDVVSRLHLLENFEQQAPYSHAEDLLTSRILTAIGQLGRHPAVTVEWQKAAFLAYASTTYFPPRMMRASLRYLYVVLQRLMARRGLEPNFDFHVFTNDPGEITETFFRVNGISGRLDHEKHARVPGVAELGQHLLDLRHSIPQRQEAARQALRTIAQRKTWVLLADQTLSGHSLEKDIERLLMLQRAFQSLGSGHAPTLHVLCQIATSTARTNLRAIPEIAAALESYHLTINEAIHLDDKFKLCSDRFAQIADRQHVESLRDLCKWFANEYICCDIDLARMRSRSGDDLAFGYRKAGLLIVRQENCPTDSIPLLWYRGKGRAGIEYCGPYPRVHSRVGGQNVEPTQDTWELISDDATIISDFVELRLSDGGQR